MDLLTLYYNDKQVIVRKVNNNAETLWCLVDVCNILDLTDPHKVAERVDEDDKFLIETSTTAGKRKAWFVNESGLYQVIFESNKPEAKVFRKWVTKEVLPTIRKYGQYPAPDHNHIGSNANDTRMVQRYNRNFSAPPFGYASIINIANEVVLRIGGCGYEMPDFYKIAKKARGMSQETIEMKEMQPEISIGLGVAKFIRENYPDSENLWITYTHTTSRGVKVEARAYINWLRPVIEDWIQRVWIPTKSKKYFSDRDPEQVETINNTVDNMVRQIEEAPRACQLKLVIGGKNETTN